MYSSLGGGLSTECAVMRTEALASRWPGQSSTGHHVIVFVAPSSGTACPSICEMSPVAVLMFRLADAMAMPSPSSTSIVTYAGLPPFESA